jgi:amidase
LPAAKKKRLRDFKVALVLDDANAEVDRVVQDRLQTLADFLGSNKAKVDDRARPDFDSVHQHRVYVALLRAATSGRQSEAQFERNVATARTLRPDDDGYFARMTRANVMPHKQWLAHNEERHRLRLKWAEFFQDYDLLLCPTASTPACPHDHAGERWERTITVNGKPVPAVDQLFWAGYASLAYLPATAAPIGFSKEGLPIGVQIIGPQYHDRTCIAFAGLIEREFQAFVPPPGYE